MKAITWDAATRLFKEVITGRIFTASSEPVDIADGDLWIDSSSTPVLKAKVAGTIYEVISGGGGGGGGPALLADDIVNEMLVAAPAGVDETETLAYELHAIDDNPAVAALDTLRTEILSLSPVGYWKLDDTASPPQDSSGNARHGSATGAVTYRGTRGGIAESYATFGSNASMPVADNNAWTPGAGGMTVFFLSRVTSVASVGFWLMQKGTTGSFEWTVNELTGGVVEARLRNAAGTDLRRVVTASGVMVINTWQAFAVTFSGNTEAATIEIFLNSNTPLGVTSSTAASGTVANGTGVLALGYRPDLTFYSVPGSMAHCAIFTGVLSGAQIGSLMSAAAADGWI